VSAFFGGDSGAGRTYCLALSLDFEVVRHVSEFVLDGLRCCYRVVRRVSKGRQGR